MSRDVYVLELQCTVSIGMFLPMVRRLSRMLAKPVGVYVPVLPLVRYSTLLFLLAAEGNLDLPRRLLILLLRIPHTYTLTHATETNCRVENALVQARLLVCPAPLRLPPPPTLSNILPLYLVKGASFELVSRQGARVIIVASALF